ncbi:hypothetical protein BpHYR1_034161 [Brachionus plicatilis]|uniref:Uncharacterized protein n=1 Tax=Brachionus plicatilis TaxID=10195 RepID=A0A3M7QQS5_BRAPC|nr:hypothetical protein BpHYR1_034161 [Brachionus plicatilis]
MKKIDKLSLCNNMLRQIDITSDQYNADNFRNKSESSNRQDPKLNNQKIKAFDLIYYFFQRNKKILTDTVTHQIENREKINFFQSNYLTCLVNRKIKLFQFE